MGLRNRIPHLLGYLYMLLILAFIATSLTGCWYLKARTVPRPSTWDGWFYWHEEAMTPKHEFIPLKRR